MYTHGGVMLTLLVAKTSQYSQAAEMEARLSGLSSLLLALLISAYAPPAACMRERTQLIHHHAESSHEELRALYVDTLKKSVTGILLETPGYVPELMAEKSQLELRPFQLETRIKGEDWPVQVLTSIASCPNFRFHINLHVA